MSTLLPTDIPEIPQEALSRESVQGMSDSLWQTLHRHSCKIYAGFILFTAVFAAVYEYFSHGIISIYMVGAPVIPTVLGFIPCLLIAKGKLPSFSAPLFARDCWHGGVASLTMASIFKGVIYIFGTTSVYTPVLFVVAGIQFGLALVIILCSTLYRKRDRKRDRKRKSRH